MINKQSISAFQLFFVLIHVQIGVGVVSLPYDIFIEAGRDSWMTVLITGSIIQLLILLYGLLMHRFPSKNLFEIVKTLFGKVIGKIFSFLLCLLYIFLGGLVLTRFAYLIQAWMMPHTPKWILLALMCFTAVYVVRENLQVIARFSFISSVFFIGFIGSALYALKFATFTYLLPVAENGILPVIEGLPSSLFAFQGFELLLLIYPFVQASNKEVLKVATFANLFVTFFYLFLVTVTMVFFSSEELKHIPEPVLYLLKAFTFRIIERPDLLFTSMWIVFVATTLSLTVYIASLGLSNVKQPSSLGKYAIIVVVPIFLAGMTFNERHTIEQMATLQSYILVPLLWALPIVLLLISFMMNKKDEVKKQ